MAKRWRIALSIVACACGGASDTVDAPPVDPPVVNPAAFVSVTGPLQRFGRVDGLYYECAYEWTARVTGDPGGVLYWAGVEVEVTTKRGKDQSTAGPEFLTSVFGRDHLSVGDSARGVARIGALQVLYDAPDPVPHVARVGIRYTQKPPGQTSSKGALTVVTSDCVEPPTRSVAFTVLDSATRRRFETYIRWRTPRLGSRSLGGVLPDTAGVVRYSVTDSDDVLLRYFHPSWEQREDTIAPGASPRDTVFLGRRAPIVDSMARSPSAGDTDIVSALVSHASAGTELPIIATAVEMGPTPCSQPDSARSTGSSLVDGSHRRYLFKIRPCTTAVWVYVVDAGQHLGRFFCSHGDPEAWSCREELAGPLPLPPRVRSPRELPALRLLPGHTS